MRKATKTFKAFASKELYAKYVNNIKMAVDTEEYRNVERRVEEVLKFLTSPSRPRTEEVVSAFGWEDTPEGWKFWSNVDFAYRHYCEACDKFNAEVKKIRTYQTTLGCKD